MKNSPKQGLTDYLEILQMAGMTEISLVLPKKRQIPVAVETAEMSKKKVPAEDQPEDRNELLNHLAAKVAQCKKCAELVANRTQTVFGVGNPHAELVFIGEAPGADEDKQGIPFVGRAGKLLTDIITKGMQIEREDVYICNILRCRPPGNRNPSPEEAAFCRPFLDQTLDIIQPKYILCLGSIAASNLLDTQETIGRMRGRVHDYHGIKVVCTYHPAYLLRNPAAKSETWKDVQLLMKTMGIPLDSQ